MDFGEKLQALRKQRGMTQEELAGELFVSRTAISKWESGRGMPGIESLKAISAFFSVSLDELLSSGALLSIAEKDRREREHDMRSGVFGALDLGFLLYLFLPLFAMRSDGAADAVSLLSLEASVPVKALLISVSALPVVWGILLLALKSVRSAGWLRVKDLISVGLTSLAVITFTVCLQPYAAVFAFSFLVIKVILLIKRA